MAHYAKYNMGACGAMMHHYCRDREATLERDNIDRERTPLNYCLGPGRTLDDIRERVREVSESAGRAVRSDAITMCDWVITQPPDVLDEDRERFFEKAYEFVRDRYGEENMLGGWVHMDESTPHIHVSFMPVVERDDGRLSFSAKSLVDREDLRTFHQDLSRAMELELGYPCQILLDDDDRLGKALSRMPGLEEYKSAKDEIRRTNERLGRLRQDERAALERNQMLGVRAGQLRQDLGERKDELQKAQGKEKALAPEVARLRGQVRELGAKERALEEEGRQLGEGRLGLEAVSPAKVDRGVGREANSLGLQNANASIAALEANLARLERRLGRLEEHKLQNRDLLPDARRDVERAKDALAEGRARAGREPVAEIARGAEIADAPLECRNISLECGLDRVPEESGTQLLEDLLRDIRGPQPEPADPPSLLEGISRSIPSGGSSASQPDRRDEHTPRHHAKRHSHRHGRGLAPSQDVELSR